MNQKPTVFRNIFCVVFTAFITVLYFPPAVLTLLFTFSPDLTMWWVQVAWSNALIWAGSVKVQAEGLENIDPKQPHVYVSNHLSTLDIPVLLRTFWPVRFRFVAKKQIKYIPFLGWFLILMKFIFVDRANSRAAIASLDAAGKKIREGSNIMAFPEGTRSDSGQVMPFKKGPFALAIKAGVPIVPVALEGTERVMPKNSWNISPGPVRLKVGKPIDTRAFGEDREALATAVRDAIIQLNLELGGKGGTPGKAVAARGVEGVES